MLEVEKRIWFVENFCMRAEHSFLLLHWGCRCGLCSENTGIVLKHGHQKLRCFVRKTIFVYRLFNQALSFFFIICIFVSGCWLNSYAASCYLDLSSLVIIFSVENLKWPSDDSKESSVKAWLTSETTAFWTSSLLSQKFSNV